MSRQRRLFPLLLLLGACRFDSPAAETETTILQLRSTVPADSTEFVPTGVPVDFVLNFNRSASRDELATVRFVPAPLAAAGLRPVGSARTWVVEDVVREALPASKLLVDGPFFRGPRLLVFYSGERRSSGAFSGEVRIFAPGSTSEGTVVFALRVASGGPAAADSLFGYAIEDVALARDVPGSDHPRYRLEQLQIGVSYACVGILDTSGDGRYSIADDWWGYARSVQTGAARYVEARGAFEEAVDVRIDLAAPGTLPPPSLSYGSRRADSPEGSAR